jgi:nuclear receptor-binding protein
MLGANSFNNLRFFLVFLFCFAANFSETITDEMMQRLYKPDVVLASISRLEDPIQFKLADVPLAEKLEKFVEDVKLEFKNFCVAFQI